MKIELKEITIRQMTNGYIDKGDDGVFGYDGKLDIRPPYQREFIYKDKQRDAVITTVKKEFPLNVMYWSVKDDGNYEVIDGQQRTISVCQYVMGVFAYEFKYFHNLPSDEKEQILNYKLMVYLCSGTDSEKLQWFRIINIAGEKLTEQELRNAVYAGPWVSDAKRHFSKNACPAYGLASSYMTGSPIRQDYLETAISWLSNYSVEHYMAKHQHDVNANELWLYFQSVINWVKATFPKYRREMKGIDWGTLYNKFKDKPFDHVMLEKETVRLMLDDDVTNKRGIYEYLLTGKEKHLSIRAFSESQRRKAYEFQVGVCPKCGKYFEYEQMEADHTVPWNKGGKTLQENCQMLCMEDNREKSGR